MDEGFYGGRLDNISPIGNIKIEQYVGCTASQVLTTFQDLPVLMYWTYNSVLWFCIGTNCIKD